MPIIPLPDLNMTDRLNVIAALYRKLTGVADPVVIDDPDPGNGGGQSQPPTMANSKAEIVDYILNTFNVTIDEPGLSQMSKQELLDLIEALTDDD